MNYLETHRKHVWMIGVIAVAVATMSFGPGVGLGIGAGFAAGALLCGAMLAAIVYLVSRSETTSTQTEFDSAQHATADASQPPWRSIDT